jgi:hypothetical protein
MENLFHCENSLYTFNMINAFSNILNEHVYESEILALYSSKKKND